MSKQQIIEKIKDEARNTWSGEEGERRASAVESASDYLRAWEEVDLTDVECLVTSGPEARLNDVIRATHVENEDG